MILAQAIPVAVVTAVMLTALLAFLNRQADARRISRPWLAGFFVLFVLVLTWAFWSGD